MLKVEEHKNFYVHKDRRRDEGTEGNERRKRINETINIKYREIDKEEI